MAGLRTDYLVKGFILEIPVFVDNQKGRHNPEALCLLDASIVEELWRRCDESKADYFPPGFVKNPRCWIFTELVTGFYFRAARARLTTGIIGREFYLSFSEGRHRTRWLLDLGVKSIPLGFCKAGLEKLVDLGVDHRVVSPGFVFDLPFPESQIIELYSSQGEADRLLYHEEDG